MRSLQDLPLGAFPSGMPLWLVNGVGVLALLTLPISVALVLGSSPEPLGWHHVGAQVIASALGCAVLVRRARRDVATV